MLDSDGIRLSANLGFLFSDQDLCGAVRAAAQAGFDAVECHWPFDTNSNTLKATCEELGLPMLGLNTWPGDRAGVDFGLAALADRQEDARREIDRALDYAAASGTRAVHVMAGVGGDEETFARNLDYACARAAKDSLSILIEPLNTRDVPDYVLTGTVQAMRLQDRVGADNLKIMFDCYHMQIMQGDLLKTAAAMMDRIGHIQFAAVPDRGEPDIGEVNYAWLLPALVDAGYDGYFGAEYRPRGADTAAGLGWLRTFRTA